MVAPRLYCPALSLGVLAALHLGHSRHSTQGPEHHTPSLCSEANANPLPAATPRSERPRSDWPLDGAPAFADVPPASLSIPGSASQRQRGSACFRDPHHTTSVGNC